MLLFSMLLLVCLYSMLYSVLLHKTPDQLIQLILGIDRVQINN